MQTFCNNLSMVSKLKITILFISDSSMNLSVFLFNNNIYKQSNIMRFYSY